VARAHRIQIPGGIFHVYAHGVDDRPVFRDVDDRLTFQSRLADVIARHGWSCFAFCQLTTHYHLLVQTRLADLGVGMKRLNQCHAQAYNRRHGRRGHLFESRYGSVHVSDDAQLLTVLAYIALNPVRAGLTQHPLAWEWSSYRQTVRARGRGIVPTHDLFPFLGRTPVEAAGRLERLVLDRAAALILPR
jgi:putative transposase